MPMQPETIKVMTHRGPGTMNLVDYEAMAEEDRPKLATAAAVKKAAGKAAKE